MCIRDRYKDNYRHLNTSSDSEVILNVFAHELQQASSFNPTPEQIFKAVEKTHLRLQGAYSVLLMISGVGLVGIRDPKGIRPLILGKKDNDLIGSDYMIASESPALSALEFEIEGDLKPGEAVFITLDGEIHRKVCHSKPSKNPCIFEYVYFAIK